jgi:hypothetical protein
MLVLLIISFRYELVTDINDMNWLQYMFINYVQSEKNRIAKGKKR